MDLILTVCLALPFFTLIAVIGWMMIKSNPSFLLLTFRGISKEKRASEYKERVAAILGGGPILVILFSIVLTLFLIGSSVWFIGPAMIVLGVVEFAFMRYIMTRNDKSLIRNSDEQLNEE